MAVTVTDNRAQVKAKMGIAVGSALREAGSEVAAHANSNVKMQHDTGQKLRGSYSAVQTAPYKMTVGTPLEEGFWEEFGTGSQADLSKNGGISGRPQWWVYVANETPRATNPVYLSEAEAKAIAASLRADGKDAYATNGNPANYTLEKAFTFNKDKIERIFANNIGTGMN